MNKDLKTAFILAMVADGLIDVLLIAGIYLGSFVTFFTGNYYIYYIAGCLIASLVLAIMALYYLSRVKHYERREKVFYILTRVFSIIIIACCGAILVIGGFVLYFLNYYQLLFWQS